MRGLRTQEPSDFIEFFDIIQTEAAKRGCVFFAESEDGHEERIGGLDCCDMAGWLIPNHLADEFEQVWKEHKENDDWVDFFIFAEWHTKDSDILIDFVSLDTNWEFSNAM